MANDSIHLDDDSIKTDAETSLGRSPEDRYAMFCGLQSLIGEIWKHFSEEEMKRRLLSAEQIDPSPKPWWRHIKSESLP